MIILYDSKCDFCVWFIRLVDKKIKKDIHVGKYDLRTVEARQFLRQKNINFINLNTIYLIENEVYVKSRAVLKIIRKMQMPYSMLYSFGILPVKVTDALYDFVARNRYRISRLFRHHQAQQSTG